MSKEIRPDEYLSRDFDYTKLTKPQIRKILYENGVEDIPPIAALKSELLASYKKNIVDKLINTKSNLTQENPFQKAAGQSSLGNPATPKSGVKAQVKIKEGNGSMIGGRVIDQPSTKSAKSIADEIREEKSSKGATQIKNKGNETPRARAEPVADVRSTPNKNLGISYEAPSRSTLGRRAMSTDQQGSKDQVNTPKFTPTRRSSIAAAGTPHKASIGSRENTKGDDWNREHDQSESQGETGSSQGIGYSPYRRSLDSEDEISLVDMHTESFDSESKYSSLHLGSSAQMEEEDTNRLYSKKRSSTADSKQIRSDPNLLRTCTFSSDKNKGVITGRTKKNVNLPGMLYLKSKNRSGIFKYLFWMLLALGIVYLRFYCPYCKGTELFCAKVPSHARLNGNVLEAEPGYLIKEGLLGKYAIKDNREEKRVAKHVFRIIWLLEGKNSDYYYNLVKDNRVPLSSLTSDPAVVSALMKTNKVTIENGLVCARERRVRVKTFVRYYSRRLAMFAVPFIVVSLFALLVQKRMKSKRERIAQAQKIIRDVTSGLMRQVIVSTKNSSIPGYVQVDQLQDIFGADKHLWMEVCRNIERNSNVKEMTVDKKKVWEWIGPIIYKPELGGSLLFQ